MGSAGTRQPVMAYLTANPGKPVNVDAMMEATGLTKAQIQHQMKNLKDNIGLPITVLVKANTWVYNPEPEAPAATPDAPAELVAGELFEYVGRTKSGIILRGPDGALWKAVEMD